VPHKIEKGGAPKVAPFLTDLSAKFRYGSLGENAYLDEIFQKQFSSKKNSASIGSKKSSQKFFNVVGNPRWGKKKCLLTPHVGKYAGKRLQHF